MSPAIGKRCMAVAAGTLVVLAVAAVMRSNTLQPASESFTGTFEQEIVRVTPLNPGLISEVLVHEGDHLEAGDVLLRLDDSAVRSRLDHVRDLANRASSQLDAASFLANLSPDAVAQLLDRNPEIQAAERAYVRAVSEADRAPADSATRSKLSEAAARRDEVRAKVSRQWRAAFPAGADLSSQIKQQLREMQDQLGASSITAPCAGTVEILRLQRGDPVFPGQPVAAIAQSGRFYVDVYAAAAERGHTEEGLAAQVRIGNFAPVMGKLQHISRAPVDFGLTPTDEPQSLFQIHVTIDNPPPGSHPGMAATVLLEHLK